MTRAVERAARRRLAQVRAMLAARLRGVLPGARVEERDDGVVISGRGVVRRWVDDPSLTWWRQ